MKKYHILIIAILLLQVAFASDAIYVYKTQTKIDGRLGVALSNLGYTVETVREDNLPADITVYDLMLVGPEAFREDIPVGDIPTVIINKRRANDWGLVTNSGAQQLSQSRKSQVIYQGEFREVHTVDEDPSGTDLYYYYLGETFSVGGIQSIARTPNITSGPQHDGDVVGIIPAGTNLLNNEVNQADMCFFGIVLSDYWTDLAADLFDECVLAIQGCDDGDCDDDGVDDSIDNCPNVANPTQIDTDNDGQGNECDTDDDNDGVPDNGPDNCQLNANPGQEDNENDGIGDICDPDDDNDGVGDITDNCPIDNNTDQLDTDTDGEGDACDADDDGDGIDDGTDNCPLISNPDQTDTDNDGAGDACDVANNVPQCQDGIDNDNDGDTDFPADADCENEGDNSEADENANAIAVELIAPTATTYTDNGVPLFFAVTGDEATCWYTLNNVETTIAGCQNTTINNLISGTYALTVYANNSAGVTNSSSVTFSIDVFNLDNVTSDLADDSIVVNNEEDFTVDFDSTDYPINITFNLYRDTSLINTSGPFVIASEANASVVYTIASDLVVGTYTLNMTAVNNQQESHTVTVDTWTITAPAATTTTTGGGGGGGGSRFRDTTESEDTENERVELTPYTYRYEYGTDAEESAGQDSNDNSGDGDSGDGAGEAGTAPNPITGLVVGEDGLEQQCQLFGSNFGRAIGLCWYTHVFVYLILLLFTGTLVLRAWK